MCTQSNQSYASAKANKFDLNVNVADYVDGVLGTTSNETNWRNNFSYHCSGDLSSILSRNSATTYLQAASEAAYNAVVKCVQVLAERRGIFGVLKIKDQRDGFAIKVTNRTEANNKWQLQSLHITPPNKDFSCDDNLHQATPQHPIQINQGGYVITCKKPASAELIVAINTDQEPLDTYTLKSVTDEIEGLRYRIETVSATNQRLKEDLGSLEKNSTEKISGLTAKMNEFKYMFIAPGDPCPTGMTPGPVPFFLPVNVEQARAAAGSFGAGGIIAGGSWVQNAFVCVRK